MWSCGLLAPKLAKIGSVMGYSHAPIVDATLFLGRCRIGLHSRDLSRPQKQHYGQISAVYLIISLAIWLERGERMLTAENGDC